MGKSTSLAAKCATLLHSYLQTVSPIRLWMYFMVLMPKVYICQQSFYLLCLPPDEVAHICKFLLLALPASSRPARRLCDDVRAS